MVYLIAEVGINHMGKLDLALQLTRAAKEAGADAVKFQTFQVENLTSPIYAKEQTEFFKSVQLSFGDFGVIHEEASRLKLDFISTPFDNEAVDFLDDLPVSRFKVSSGDLTNFSLLSYIARKGKQIFLSTGMASISEISDAISVIRRNGNNDTIVFHAVSAYPTPYECANLLAVRTLANTFDLPVGYSDHTVGNEACLAAVALGASVIEKHFRLNENQYGPDIACSADPAALAELRKGINIVSSALGDGRKVPQPCEDNAIMMARRSVYVKRNLKKGELLTPDLLVMLRPGTGIPATLLFEVVGHRLKCDVSEGEMLHWEMLEGA